MRFAVPSRELARRFAMEAEALGQLNHPGIAQIYGFEDRILWIKAAAAKYPYLDLTRVGIYGTSAGGQNAAMPPAALRAIGPLAGMFIGAISGALLQKLWRGRG